MGRLYYGWIIVLACNFIACVTWGVAIFNQGIYVAYYVKAFGWSLPALSVAPVLFHLTAGGAGVLVGRIVDKHGARPALIAGAIFLTAALLGLAHVSAIWHVYLAFPLLGVGFACIHTVTIGKIVSRWFLAKRTRAMASATFGAGVGGAVLVPLNVLMIERYGLLAGSLTLIAVSIVILVPVALFVIKDGPEALGQYVDGAPAPTSIETATSAIHNRDAREWSVSEAMQTAAFYALAFCFAFGMLAQSAFLFHQAPFLEATVGLMGAAAIVSITTISGLVGRVGFILVGDRMTPRAWCTIVFACQALAFATLALAETAFWLTLGSALFGLTMGLVVTLQPLGVAYMFGRASFGRIYGPIYMSIRIGSAIGPAIVGGVLAAAGGYSAAWIAVAVSLGLAIGALPWALNPKGPQPGANALAAKPPVN